MINRDGIQCKQWIWLFLFVFLAGLERTSWAANTAIQSKWDKNLLSVELGDVRIQQNTMAGAWQEITRKYLLRANLYMDATAVSNMTTFAFHKEKATCKELFDAFLAAYPTFTYTQNPETGIIWFHPKQVYYGDILNQKIGITSGASCVPMYTDIYAPLCKLLAPKIVDSSNAWNILSERERKSPIPSSWLYDVDLPSGVYSVREILDFCCVANPIKAFLVSPESKPESPLIIHLVDLLYDNPLAPPRVGAITFWQFGIGKPTNGIPSLEEIRVAMSDDSRPEKRSVANLYLEASQFNYAPLYLIGNADGSEQEVWTALGAEYAEWRDANTNFFMSMAQAFPRLRDDLKKIANPNLALLAVLQLTRERQDTSYLDAVVGKHTYSEEEIASIKPELTRMARSSKAVRDKLKEMKSQVPELSPKALDELANTNFLTLVPAVKN